MENNTLVPYTGNTGPKKPEEQPVKREKIISGNAKKKKRYFSGMFSADNIDNVGEYVVEDVFIPNIKKLIYDAICNSVRMLLYGSAGGSSEKGTSSISRPAYRKAFDDARNNKPLEGYSRKTPYEDVVTDDRGDAEDILQTMDEIADTYGVARIADLYEIAGFDTKPTDNNYGWTRESVKRAKVVRINDGYLLKFPRPIPLD